MKVAILSRNSELYSTRRMVEAATGKDVDWQIIEFIEKEAKPGRTRTRGKR